MSTKFTHRRQLALEVWAGSALRAYPGLSAFFLSLVMLLPFAQAGLDVTDAGFHLANQSLYGRIGLAYIVEQPYWWFSDVIGWWWLSVTESMHLGLFGARIGGILLFSTCSAISAYIVSKHVLNHWLIPISVLCVAPFFSSFLSLISYDSVPTLLCLVAFLMYLEAVLGTNRWQSTCYSLLSGMFFFLLLLSRLPALTALVLPLGGIVLAAVINRGYLRATIVSGAIVYVVVLILSLGFYLYLHEAGLLVRIRSNQALDTTYTSDFLFSVIRGQWSVIAPKFWSLAIPFAVFCIGLLVKQKRWVLRMLPIAAVGALLTYVWVFSRSQLQDLFVGTLNYLLFMWLLLLCFVIVGFLLRKSPDDQNRSLLFRISIISGMAVSLPIIVSAGSSAGIAKLQFGGYLAPPLVIALLIWIRNFRGGCQRVLMLFISALTLLAIMAALHHLDTRGIFRDASDRSRLTSPLNAPKLSDILTTPERAQSVNGLLDALSVRPIPSGSSVLVYREAPLVYWLIDEKPFLNWVWPDVLPLSEIKRGLPSLCDEDTSPYLIVRALEPTGNPIWGGKAGIVSFAPAWQVEKYVAIDDAAAACGFRSVWKSVDFEI